MALEAVVYPQDPFTYTSRDLYSIGEGGGGGGLLGWGGYDYFCFQDQDEEDKALAEILNRDANVNNSSASLLMQHKREWDPYSSPQTHGFPATILAPAAVATTATTTTPPPPPPPDNSRRKRQRTRSSKNKEELENQRITHITVERNRRKQMNEYLNVLRSLMPPSYVQRGDQASIVGGAINFVKELEQQLQSMESRKRNNREPEQKNGHSSPFAEFLSFPQFSTGETQCSTSSKATAEPSMADIEVTMEKTHANLKILSKKRPRQLLKLIAGLQSLSLTVLHLNVTTADETALYSISVKVEEGCHLNTVDEIAATVNQMLHRIQEEAAFS